MSPRSSHSPERPVGRARARKGSAAVRPRRRVGALFEQYARRGDARAREELVVRFLPLARKVALRYQSTSEPLEDLLQVARLALLNAVDRFDPDRGVAFSSFAVPTMVGEIKRHFRDRTWAVRPPRDLQEHAVRVQRVIDELSESLGRSPTIAEIAQAMRTDEEGVLEALEAAEAHRARSLQTPRGYDDGDPALGDTVGGEDPGFEQAEDRALLGPLMRVIGAREREVLRLRFEEDMTQAEIAAILGVSQMQVSRLVRRSLARLREVALTAEPAAARRPEAAAATRAGGTEGEHHGA